MDLQKILDTKPHFYAHDRPIRASITLRTLFGFKNSRANPVIRSPELLDCLQGYVIATGSGIVVKQLDKPYFKNLKGCYTLLGEVS